VVHSRHLSGLSTDESTSSVEASGGDTLDDGSSDVDVELGARKVVEEVERLGSLDDQVVDRHGDEVDSYKKRRRKEAKQKSVNSPSESESERRGGGRKKESGKENATHRQFHAIHNPKRP